MRTALGDSSLIAMGVEGKKRRESGGSGVQTDRLVRPGSSRLAFARCAMLLLGGLLGSINVQAQTATYSHGNSATATGSGTSGTPSLSFNVQAGQNRVVFINAAFEREHCSNSRDIGQEDSCSRQVNWASRNLVSTSGASAQVTFRVAGAGGSLTLQNPVGSSEGDLYFAYLHRSLTAFDIPETVFSAETYAIVLYEHQLRSLLGGTGAGTLTITLPTSGLNAPRRAGDEALLSALQFNHVHQRWDAGEDNGVVRSALAFDTCGGTSLGTYFGGAASSNWVCPMGGAATAYDWGQEPDTGDGLLQFGWNGYSSSSSQHGFAARSGSTDVLTPSVLNANTGTWLGGTEPDGFSTVYRWTTSGVGSGAPAMTARAPSGTTGGMWLGYTIRHAILDLSITKTDGITSMLPGASTTYTIVVTNNDYDGIRAYADGAVVRDPAATGLTKTAVSCTASDGAVCPSGLTIASLESGATISSFPPGGSLSFSVTATAGTGAAGSVTNTATVTAPSGFTDGDTSNNTASDTNTLVIPLTLQKTWANATVNDAVRLTLTGSPAPNGGATLNAVANTANETDTGTTPYGVVAGRTYTITELFTTGTATGYTKALTCTGNTGTGSTLNYTANALSGTITIGNTATAITCTFTNTAGPRLTLIKTVTNDDGGTQLPTAWTLSATGPTTITGATGSAAVTNAAVSPGMYTLSESALPAGYSSTPYRCAVNGGAAVSGNSIVLAAGDTAICTINNNDNPARLTLVKTVTNDNGGTQPAAAWTLSAAGPTAISGATGTAAVTSAVVEPGTYTLSESATPTGYVASLYSCAINGGAAVSGNSITLAAGDAATCTIHNDDSNQADVRIEKSALPSIAASGGQVAFTLVVTNEGPAAAHGAVVRDPAVAGLDCAAAGLPAPTCSATGSAACPASLTASGLQSGVAIPALPNGGVVTIGLTCNVTASGF